MKKVALENFTKFTGKHLCQSLFFNKIAGLRAETQTQVFPVKLVKFLRTPYLQNTSGRLLLILFKACFSYFPLSKVFATKKATSCEKSRLVENRL